MYAVSHVACHLYSSSGVNGDWWWWIFELWVQHTFQRIPSSFIIIWMGNVDWWWRL